MLRKSSAYGVPVWATFSNVDLNDCFSSSVKFWSIEHRKKGNEWVYIVIKHSLEKHCQYCAGPFVRFCSHNNEGLIISYHPSPFHHYGTIIWILIEFSSSRKDVEIIVVVTWTSLSWTRNNYVHVIMIMINPKTIISAKSEYMTKILAKRLLVTVLIISWNKIA